MRKIIEFTLIFVLCISSAYIGSMIALKVVGINTYSDDLFLIQELGQRFANNHEYVIHEYDCSEYSRDFNFILENIGIESSVRFGKNETTTHAWNKICLDYEAITAEFTNYKDEFK